MPKSDLEVKKQFEELYKTRNLEIARSILQDHFGGNLEYSTAAQDLVTAMNNLADEENAEECANMLEKVVIGDRKKDERNPQTYRWAADTQYALRVLAENHLFAELGYDQKKIEGLADKFNEKYSDREYSIGRFGYTHPKTREIAYINPQQKKAA